jgi:hypothetical protein
MHNLAQKRPNLNVLQATKRVEMNNFYFSITTLSQSSDVGPQRRTLGKFGSASDEDLRASNGRYVFELNDLNRPR